MTQDDFSKVVERRFGLLLRDCPKDLVAFQDAIKRRQDLSTKVLLKKSAEYSTPTDKLHNFKKAAKVLNSTPQDALIGFVTKHWVKLMDWLEKDYTPTLAEADETIGDIVNYILLFEAMYPESLEPLPAVRILSSLAYAQANTRYIQTYLDRLFTQGLLTFPKEKPRFYQCEDHIIFGATIILLVKLEHIWAQSRLKHEPQTPTPPTQSEIHFIRIDPDKVGNGAFLDILLDYAKKHGYDPTGMYKDEKKTT